MGIQQFDTPDRQRFFNDQTTRLLISSERSLDLAGTEECQQKIKTLNKQLILVLAKPAFLYVVLTRKIWY